MKRAYYSNSISEFIKDDNSKILGELSINHTHALEELQRNAWLGEISILKDQLQEFSEGQVYFEFAIPRMGKRVDNIVIINDVVFILEFKVGDYEYGNHAIEQVIDYTLDLKNFHEGSHHNKLVPILVSTNAPDVENDQEQIDELYTAARVNKNNLGAYLKEVLKNSDEECIDHVEWETSIYKPTPTIVEAAQALYKGHNVQEISRSDSGAINLSRTAACLNNVVETSKKLHKKSICFVTGVPGAGKTLAGLNIANERMKSDEDEHAVFLSGNGPLVTVLREALTRDEVKTSKENGNPLTKKQAAIKANSFIQNIHHFRDDNLISLKAPVEKVVVFDEAQRAWTMEKASSFMKVKKGKDDFNMSEPEFLIDVMNRHQDWCIIICLIGGGQEINTGEAGLEEWITALKEHYADWDIHYSDLIRDNKNYIKSTDLRSWIEKNGESEKDLHLAVSVRSFRSEQLSNFVHELLELKTDLAKSLFQEIKDHYPIVLTRDLDVAKDWLRNNAKGTERIGMVGSSGARRLRPHSIDVKNEISPAEWFLNDENDIRSSYFLEVVATEFDIQGLEIDWVCLAWGANFYINSNNEWNYQNFSG
uniref:DNA/RNA helicase domain-containing protein n=1 Tax=Flavobacterium sp. TaxID=239 RepID=UPI004047A0B2